MNDSSYFRANQNMFINSSILYQYLLGIENYIDMRGNAEYKFDLMLINSLDSSIYLIIR